MIKENNFSLELCTHLILYCKSEDEIKISFKKYHPYTHIKGTSKRCTLGKKETIPRERLEMPEEY